MNSTHDNRQRYIRQAVVSKQGNIQPLEYGVWLPVKVWNDHVEEYNLLLEYFRLSASVVEDVMKTGRGGKA